MPKLQKILNSKTSEKLLTFLIVAAALWYIILCIINYAYQRPLWNDEQCVLNSVKAFSPEQMFNKELLNLQVFPRTYLFLIQKISEPFDYHLLSLRFFSFVFMLGGFFIWLKIASFEFKEKLYYLSFVLCWTASAVLLYYSAELKQYSMDVFATSLFILYLYRQKAFIENEKHKLHVMILIALPALGMFSYMAFLMCFLPFYNLCILAKEDKKNFRFLIPYLISLCVFVILSYFFDMRLRGEVAVQSYLNNEYFIFFTNIPEFFRTFTEGTMNLFGRWFVERPRILKKISIFFAVFGLIYLFYGFFKNIKKDKWYLKSLDTMAFFIFIGLALLGSLKMYPFTAPRRSLFFCPVVMYLIVQGIAHLRNINIYLYRIVHAAFFVWVIYLTIVLSQFYIRGDIGFQPVLW